MAATAPTTGKATGRGLSIGATLRLIACDTVDAAHAPTGPSARSHRSTSADGRTIDDSRRIPVSM